jgi:hypothetical protein
VLFFLGNRNVVKRNAEKIGVALGVRMIADHQGKIASEFSVALAVQQIHQAVIVLGNENGHAGPAITGRQHPIHAEFVSDRPESSIEIAQV